MESAKPTTFQKIKGIVFISAITGLIIALYFYLTEPTVAVSDGTGGILSAGSFTYEARRNFAFILGFFGGGFFGTIFSSIFVLIPERRILLLTLYGFLFGVVCFLTFYLYKLNYIYQTWNDDYTINSQSDKAFYGLISIIGICTIAGLATSIVKNVLLKSTKV